MPYEGNEYNMAKEEIFDFYSKTTLKSYNLDERMQYQLNILGSLDVFTRQHCENVANLTCRICEYMNYPKSFTEYCTICAYLHDIGKQFIPSSILQSPKPLTDEQYEVMKTHTTIGYNICMKDLKLRPYAAGTIYHHEALDGSGYPKGLTKKEIPIEGQIIRVADIYDALVSKRQYKSHLDISETLKILVDETKPSPRNTEERPTHALSFLVKDVKYGKTNPKFLKALFRVVIDDTEYEIFLVSEYVEHVKEEIERLTQASKYYDKMQSSKKDKDKEYYKRGVLMLLKDAENIDNFLTVLDEYKQTLSVRLKKIDALRSEIKKIKELKKTI